MTKIPRVSGKQVADVLRKADFELSYIKGSHYYFTNSSKKGLVCVPIHGTKIIPLGTLFSILKQSGLTAEQFKKLI